VPPSYPPSTTSNFLEILPKHIRRHSRSPSKCPSPQVSPQTFIGSLLLRDLKNNPKANLMNHVLKNYTKSDLNAVIARTSPGILQSRPSTWGHTTSINLLMANFTNINGEPRNLTVLDKLHLMQVNKGLQKEYFKKYKDPRSI
jgi:hypothetical protein